MKLIILIACLFCVKTSSASVPVKYILTDTAIDNIDTSVNKKEYQLNHKEFLEKYGKDDSSKALINLYFRKRSAGKIGFLISLPLTLFSTGILISATSDPHNNTGSIGFAIFEIVFGLLITACAVPLIISTINWIKYSRKRLLMQLTNYFNGGSIPKSISKSRAFKRLLKKSY